MLQNMMSEKEKRILTTANAGVNIDKMNELDDRRIKNIKPLIPPQLLMEDVPLTDLAGETVYKARLDAEEIISGGNPNHKLLVIVGKH
jgi:3-deoxy-7-phosphoheptulonate synthase